MVAQVHASDEPLTTAEVRGRITPQPSVDTALRALTAAAKDGRILREPPIAEDAWRRTVKWVRSPSTAGKLPQDLHTHMGEISAVDDVAADSPSLPHTVDVTQQVVSVALSPDWLAADDARRVAQMAAGKARRALGQSR